MAPAVVTAGSAVGDTVVLFPIARVLAACSTEVHRESVSDQSPQAVKCTLLRMLSTVKPSTQDHEMQRILQIEKRPLD